MLAVGWVRSASWVMRLGVLVPLAASIVAGVAAFHLHTTYLVLLRADEYDGPAPLGWYQLVDREVAAAAQNATILGWLVILITGIVVAAGVLTLWRRQLWHGRDGRRATWHPVGQQPG